MGVIVKFLLSAVPAVVLAADIYVSPTGTGHGSLESPLGDIQEAVDLASPGDTIYLRGGTYAPQVNVQIRKSGTSSAPYVVTAYQGEQVTIDGVHVPKALELGSSLPNNDRGIFHIEDADYWRFYNLTFTRGPYGVYTRDASNNYFERIVTHDNYETGFQIQGSASNNEVVYLDSYRNADPRKNGESADGFAIKEGEGEGNILRGARLWDNVDDGLDFWQFKSGIQVYDTIAWGNGFNRWGFSPFEGDGNGFKLGGSQGDIGPANHVIVNCIAFDNLARGIIDNGNPGHMTFERNTAWNNGGLGFQQSGDTAEFTDNIAALNRGGSTRQDNQVSFRDVDESGNSWNLESSWSNSDFVSTDAELVKGPRLPDGKIQASDFLRPANGLDIGATTEWC